MAAPDFVAQRLYTQTIASSRVKRRAASQGFFKSAMPIAEAAADFVMCTSGMALAYALCAPPITGTVVLHGVQNAVAMSALVGFTVVFLLHRDGAYRRAGGLLQIRETERAIRVSSQTLLFLLAINLFLGLHLSFLEILVSLIAVPASLVVEKRVFLAIARILQHAEGSNERVVVYGAGETGRFVVSALLQSPRLWFEPVALIDDDRALAGDCVLEMGYRGRRPIRVERGPVTAARLESLHCDLLLLAAPSLSPRELAAATRAAQQIGMDVAILNDPGTSDWPASETIDVDGVMFTTSREHTAFWLHVLAKRIADMVISFVLLVLLAPLLFVIAIIIRLDSSGPAIFVQKRVGRNGELFDIYKFRSMLAGAPKYAPSPTSSRDPRLTRVGRILRRMSLDELPQLINVLKGTMSLVGPRPEMPFVVERYDARQRQRLKVAPGITGLWQLSADRAFPIHHNLGYDLYYIHNRSFAMDLAILLHTLVFALCGGI
jgi:exopolysaccharide biosynthesis polyprenyl glycosylphosphotransferase